MICQVLLTRSHILVYINSNAVFGVVGIFGTTNIISVGYVFPVNINVLVVAIGIESNHANSIGIILAGGVDLSVAIIGISLLRIVFGSFAVGFFHVR